MDRKADFEINVQGKGASGWNREREKEYSVGPPGSCFPLLPDFVVSASQQYRSCGSQNGNLTISIDLRIIQIKTQSQWRLWSWSNLQVCKKTSPFGQTQDISSIAQHLICEMKFECQVTQEIMKIIHLSPMLYFSQTWWRKSLSFLCKHGPAQYSFSVNFNSLSKII